MNLKFLGYAAVANVFITVASADTTIRYLSVDQAGDVVAIERLHMTSTKMAMTAEESKITTVFDAEKNELFTIDRQEATVTQVDPDAVVRIAEETVATREKVLQEMDQRLAKMSEEERAQFQGAADEIREIHQTLAEQSAPATHATRPGTEKVGDFDAAVIDASRNDEKIASYFMVDHEKLGITEEELAVLTAFQAFVHAMADRMPEGANGGFGDIDLMVSETGGIPVKRVKLAVIEEGEIVQKILNGVDHDAVPTDLFEIPEDYEERSL